MNGVGTWVKLSKAIGSGTSDPVQSESAIAPVPTIASANKPAPGQTGPKGLAPRTTYSKVNTGTPPTTSVGMNQKTVPPLGAAFLPRKTAQVNMTTMIGRPSLQELMASAMEGTMDKVAVSVEASRQLGEERQKEAAQSSDYISTEMASKLAGAMSYIAKLAQEGQVQVVGEGPGALDVMASNKTDKMPGPGDQGQATAAHQAPMNPPLQPEKKQTGKANTGLQTNDETHLPPYPTEPIKNQQAAVQPPSAIPEATDMTAKSASVRRVLGAIGKLKKTSSVAGAPVAILRKLAEDAINPAQVSGKKEVPPPATQVGEGTPAEPSDVTSQKSMISSNQSAIGYKKVQAKKDPISDVEQVVTEPAMSASTDSTLQQTLDHTQEAGAKISMAKNAHQIAAARALLMKLAQEEEQKKEEEKKDEESKENGNGEGKKGNGEKKPMPFRAQEMKKEKESQMSMTSPASFQGPPPTPGGSMPTGM